MLVTTTSTTEEVDALDVHSINAVEGMRPAIQNAPVQPPLPIPLATENDVFVITTPGQFAQMAELGLDRYLAVMTDEQRELARATQTGLLVVQGSGGSGKTTVAVHRTRFLADQIIAQPRMLDDGPRRVLYICFNYALAQTVKQLLASLYGEQPPDHIEVTTLHAWAKDYLTRREALRDSAHPQRPSAYNRLENTDGWIANSVRRRQRDALSSGGNILWRRYPIQFFVTEIMQVIVGRGLRTLEDYLAAGRSGRGVGLSAADRHLIWGLYEDWRSRLQTGGVIDLASLPGLALEELKQDPGFVPYEAVIIDEAQDFTPVQLRLAIKLAGGNLSHVTVFADAAQVIYPTGFSWKLAELNPRGAQIRTLRQNLRNTVEIHEAAQRLLGRCAQSETREEFSEAEPPRTHGQSPDILICADASVEEAAVCQRIRAQLAKGIPPQTIAVLAGTHEKLKLMGEAMRRWNIPHQAVNERRRISITHESVKILTMHSAKGLDFPHVYIVGLTTNGLPGARNDHPDGADDESLERQRRLLYTAMIRAGSTLVLSTIAGNEHVLLSDLRDADCQRQIIR